MRPTVSLLAALLCLSCGGDGEETPMGAGEGTGSGRELIGTWVGISNTDPAVLNVLVRGARITFALDGSFTTQIGESPGTTNLPGTWSMDAGRLLMAYAGHEPTRYTFDVKDDRLTLIRVENGIVLLQEWSRM